MGMLCSDIKGEDIKINYSVVFISRNGVDCSANNR